MAAEPPDALDELLAGQLRYYRERAGSYAETAVLPVPDPLSERLLSEVRDACDEHMHGDVLELACGPGTWTTMLARRARRLTALDGAPEMLEVAAATAPGDNVRFLAADIFRWSPDRRYDAIFFGHWLSHVPGERFESFWQMVGRALAPGGTVVFVDDAFRTEDELVDAGRTELIRRRADHGDSRHLIVKVPQTGRELGERLAAVGWSFQMHDLPPLFWGVGAPA